MSATKRAALPASLPVLDGLRGLACLTVMRSHAGGRGWDIENNAIGNLGVMLFFILSGFLMGYHYMPGKPKIEYWARFMVRRTLRIYPAYVFAMLLCFCIARIDPIPKIAVFNWDHTLSYILFQDFIGRFWTIPAECGFYVIFAVSGYLLLRTPLSDSQKICIGLAGLTLLLLFRTTVYTNRLMSPLPYIEFFLSGVLAGYGFKIVYASWKRFQMFWNIFAFGLMIMLGLFCLQEFQIHMRPRGDWWKHKGYFIPILTLLLFASAFANPRWLYPLSNPVMRYIGTISYSLYLLHALPFMFIEFYTPLSGYTILFASSIAAFALATIVYYMVEKPTHELGKRITDGTKVCVASPDDSR